MSKTEIFWNILRTFKDDTLIMQIVLVALSLVAAYRVFFKPGENSDILMKMFLSFAFAWNGIACFLIYCGKSPMAAFLAGPLYLCISFLLAVDLLVRKRISFRLPEEPWHKYLTLLLMGLVYMFPAIGMALGHGFVVFPMFPCPLAAFALVLFSASAPHIDRDIFVLVLIWAFVNIPKCFGLYDCYEEIILCSIGFYSLYFLKTREPEREIRDKYLEESGCENI